ncbi:MAG: polyprenyl synthetase family protein [Ruminococcaceae bacterium]|nr:polyprenyl synthetase family protein [Oscillospiraceae bacterium]
MYTSRLQQHLTLFEESLPRYMPSTGGLQTIVAEAMAYACQGGGKRIRPVLTMEFCRLCGGDVSGALPFAAAIEMIHSYSLVHDDLPCMDNSPLRRGRPSTHAVYGETMALLAGDGLLNLAFETVLRASNVTSIPADNALRAASALADAAGIDGMVGGQVIDLQSEGKDIDLATLEALQRGKTAALLTAACVMGARLAGADAVQEEAARAYGENVGLSFQIIDDILDVTATAEQLGKPVGSDAVNQKVTYVSLLGLEEARRLAADRTAQAIKALTVFGEEADSLRHLAQALLDRDH